MMQFFVNSAVSLSVHSPFGFSSIPAHHSSLPTSGSQAATSARSAAAAPHFARSFALIVLHLLKADRDHRGRDAHCREQGQHRRLAKGRGEEADARARQQ